MSFRRIPALWLIAITVSCLLVPVGPAAAQVRVKPTVDLTNDEKGRVDNLIVRASNPELLTLGSTWEVVECCGWTGTWTRRRGTNTFDGRWVGPNGMIATDTMTLLAWDKRTNRIIIGRTNNNGTYWGVVNTGNGMISSGGTSWYPAGASWSAKMFAVDTDEKGPVTLPIRRR